LPAAFVGELLAHLVPDVLGVDEHAVEVEDDRLDHEKKVYLAGWMESRPMPLLRTTCRADPTLNLARIVGLADDEGRSPSAEFAQLLR
jgi:hypothetical protein